MNPIPLTPALCFHALFTFTLFSASAAGDGTILRYAVPPALTPPTAASGDIAEWTAEVDCAPPVDLASLIGAQVRFAFDHDLDGVADDTDSLGISPADCGESAPGHILLRRRFRDPTASILYADLTTPGDSVVASHAALVSGTGSLLKIVRYCARPQSGEPEWIEIRNVAEQALTLPRVRLEGRALSGRLAPDEAILAGSDTTELRIWQPGARILGLSSWSNMRNSGDTLRIRLEDGLVLDSVIYGPASFPLEQCASLADEGSGAAAAGYTLEFSSQHWSRAGGSPALFTITVRAPANGRYDLIVYDLDGRPLCTLARDMVGPGTYVLPSSSCVALDVVRAGRVILHLSPRTAPGVRALLRIAL